MTSTRSKSFSIKMGAANPLSKYLFKRATVRALAGGGITFGTIVLVALVSLIWGFAMLALGTWILMLAIGGLHSFIHQVPAFSFWVTFLIYIVISIFTGRGSKS